MLLLAAAAASLVSTTAVVAAACRRAGGVVGKEEASSGGGEELHGRRAAEWSPLSAAPRHDLGGYGMLPSPRPLLPRVFAPSRLQAPQASAAFHADAARPCPIGFFVPCIVWHELCLA